MGVATLSGFTRYLREAEMSLFVCLKVNTIFLKVLKLIVTNDYNNHDDAQDEAGKRGRGDAAGAHEECSGQGGSAGVGQPGHEHGDDGGQGAHHDALHLDEGQVGRAHLPGLGEGVQVGELSK